MPSSRYRYTPSLDGYRVLDAQTGEFYGTLIRHRRPGTTLWEPVTPDGRHFRPSGPGRDSAAGWLRLQAHPELLAFDPPEDPIADAVNRHLDAGDRDTALAVLLAALAEDIHAMRTRRRTAPAALWAHLDRYSSWLHLVTDTPAPKAAQRPAPDRLTHLKAL